MAFYYVNQDLPDTAGGRGRLERYCLLCTSPQENLEGWKRKNKMVPKWLASLLIRTFLAQQLPLVSYRFPDTDSGQSVWSEQTGTPLESYIDPHNGGI